jgi:hypothetical protein
MSRAAASDRAPSSPILLDPRYSVVSVALLSRAAASYRAPSAPMLFQRRSMLASVALLSRAAASARAPTGPIRLLYSFSSQASCWWPEPLRRAAAPVSPITLYVRSSSWAPAWSELRDRVAHSQHLVPSRKRRLPARLRATRTLAGPLSRAVPARRAAAVAAPPRSIDFVQFAGLSRSVLATSTRSNTNTSAAAPLALALACRYVDALVREQKLQHPTPTETLLEPQ